MLNTFYSNIHDHTHDLQTLMEEKHFTTYKLEKSIARKIVK